MKIIINDEYYIKKNDNCFILIKHRILEKSKKEEKITCGYFSTLESCLKRSFFITLKNRNKIKVDEIENYFKNKIDEFMKNLVITE